MSVDNKKDGTDIDDAEYENLYPWATHPRQFCYNLKRDQETALQNALLESNVPYRRYDVREEHMETAVELGPSDIITYKFECTNPIEAQISRSGTYMAMINMGPVNGALV